MMWSARIVARPPKATPVAQIFAASMCRVSGQSTVLDAGDTIGLFFDRGYPDPTGKSSRHRWLAWSRGEDGTSPRARLTPAHLSARPHPGVVSGKPLLARAWPSEIRR